MLSVLQCQSSRIASDSTYLDGCTPNMLVRKPSRIMQPRRRAQKGTQTANGETQTGRTGGEVEGGAMEEGEVNVAVIQGTEEDVAGLRKVVQRRRSKVLRV